MRKLLYRAFGGVEVLELAETALPEPGSGEVLVRVKAAAINPVDWKLREGRLKMMSGWRMPQGQGVEFAGVVERVGPGVTAFAKGDAVLGGGKDCIAEYCIAKADQMAKKPAALPFDVASTIPCVGSTGASLFDKVRIGSGTELLVNGAAGGIGTFVTQMAAARGARVTAVASEKSSALVAGWGAVRVLDYRKANVLEDGQRYDVVVDLADRLSLAQAKRILKPGGTFVSSLPKPSDMVPGFLGNLLPGRRYALLLMSAKTATLASLAADVDSGKTKILMAKTFPLERFREAYTEAAAAKSAGKFVFVMDPLAP